MAVNSIKLPIVVYDLRVLPATFDLLGFLAVALYKVKDRFSQFDLIIVTYPETETRRNFDFLSVSPYEEISSRIFRLLMPSAKLIPAVRNISVMSPEELIELSRASASSKNIVFPENYLAENPTQFAYYKGWMLVEAARHHDLRTLKIPDKARDLASTLLNRLGLRPRGYVLLALRLNSVSEDRSRDTPISWASAVVSRFSQSFPVVLLPDIGQQITVSPSPAGSAPVHVVYDAQYDVQLRAALYAHSELAIVGPTGPSSLAYLNPECRYAYVGLTESSRFDEEFHRKQGWPENDNIFARGSRKQRWYWKYPSAETLFQQFEESLHGNG